MGIRLKRSAVAGKAPQTTDLELGELGINTYDGKLYLRRNDGTDAVLEVGPVRSVAGRTGAVTLAKADVGLGNADNTADAAKPVSTATQAALDAKANAANPALSGSIDLTTGSVRQSASAVSALDIDCSAGNYFTKTINGASSFTFSNAPASGKAFGFILRLTVTSGAVTWPASVVWPGGTAPSLATGKTHLIVFTTDNGGATWRGASNIDYGA
jgi:hypothetical protein